VASTYSLTGSPPPPSTIVDAVAVPTVTTLAARMSAGRLSELDAAAARTVAVADVVTTAVTVAAPEVVTVGAEVTRSGTTVAVEVLETDAPAACRR